MSNLLDVNVLVALVDTKHQYHDVARRWFVSHRAAGWATCPITENGVLRIVGTYTYPNYSGSLAKTVALVRALCQNPGHTFWPDEFSLLDRKDEILGRIKTAAQITDVYLLALAVEYRARLITFDRRIEASVIPGGLDAIHTLG